MRTGLGRGGEFGEDTFAKVDTALLGRAIMLKTSGAWNFKMPIWQWAELVFRVFFVRCHRRGGKLPQEVRSVPFFYLSWSRGLGFESVSAGLSMSFSFSDRKESRRDSGLLLHQPHGRVARCFSALCCFPGGSDGKEFACNAGDMGSLPGSGGSLEKRIATHSSILAWRIPWTEEPGKLQSIGSQRVGHDWVSNTFTFTNIMHSTDI